MQNLHGKVSFRAICIDPSEADEEDAAEGACSCSGSRKRKRKKKKGERKKRGKGKERKGKGKRKEERVKGKGKKEKKERANGRTRGCRRTWGKKREKRRMSVQLSMFDVWARRDPKLEH